MDSEAKKRGGRRWPEVPDGEWSLFLLPRSYFNPAACFMCAALLVALPEATAKGVRQPGPMSSDPRAPPGEAKYSHVPKTRKSSKAGDIVKSQREIYYD